MQPKRERAFDLLVHTICRVGVQCALCTEREEESGLFLAKRCHIHIAPERPFSGEVKKK